MTYSLSGNFIEACDCTVICPCWVEEDPVGGHCTGLVAWAITEGQIGWPPASKTSGKTDHSASRDINVAGAKIVSVSTHGGNRKDKKKRTTTVLYIDTEAFQTQDGEEDATERLNLLVKAFSGELKGPLKGLADVSGTVVAYERARITMPDDQREANGEWEVTVHARDRASADGGRPDSQGQDGHQDKRPLLVRADGKPQVFDTDEKFTDPLRLQYTALSHELGGSKRDEVVYAQQGGHLELNVGALPGGHLLVTGRSGMRGKFSYEEPARK